MSKLKCPIGDCPYVTEEVSQETALELIKIHIVTHSVNIDHPPSKTRKPERPEIDTGASETQWAFFKRKWETYKKRSGITGDELKQELEAACTIELQQGLFDFVGEDQLDRCTYQELIVYIKAVAVEGKNTSVHRQEFYSMDQSNGTPHFIFYTKATLFIRRHSFQITYKVDCVPFAFLRIINQ